MALSFQPSNLRCHLNSLSSHWLPFSWTPLFSQPPVPWSKWTDCERKSKVKVEERGRQVVRNVWGGWEFLLCSASSERAMVPECQVTIWQCEAELMTALPFTSDRLVVPRCILSPTPPFGSFRISKYMLLPLFPRPLAVTSSVNKSMYSSQGKSAKMCQKEAINDSTLCADLHFLACTV